ncbi:helix-turn-helix domain-containing protein [Gymnodinialimonas sp. 57CJ19]|uniref:arsenate reductase/protein-tyrosine-phosphatase family protein n=1 Tax=Gymnodinialimonas sp. 57CJ19 TaxID=3138498 RepID=UPI0031343FAE
MEILIPNRLSTLGHPQRLAVFRLLMRRYPDRVPATELARALLIKPNTLSTYVNALMQAGLVTQERVGTSLRYAIHMDAARETVDYLLNDCCRGRPEVCVPSAAVPRPDRARKANVLFICTGNSARSIFAESLLRHVAGDRFEAYSAGTNPRDGVNSEALSLLRQSGHDADRLFPQSIADFQTADTPAFDFVFTVCDQAANEECPTWRGQPVSAHWGLPDPVAASGSDAEKARAFQKAFDVLEHRIRGFAALPLASMDSLAVQRAVDALGQSDNEGMLT